MSTKYLSLRFAFALARNVLLKAIHRDRIRMNVMKVYIEAGVRIRISNGGTIRFDSEGGRIYLSRGCDLIASGGSISIGHGTFMNKGCSVVSHSDVQIGDDVMFGPYVSVFDSDHRCDVGTVPFRSQGYLSRPVSIGSNVWIGQGAVVTKGTNIDASVVVAANSVTRGRLESSGLYAGAPTRRIKDLGA